MADIEFDGDGRARFLTKYHGEVTLSQTKWGVICGKSERHHYRLNGDQVATTLIAPDHIRHHDTEVTQYLYYKRFPKWQIVPGVEGPLPLMMTVVIDEETKEGVHGISRAASKGRQGVQALMAEPDVSKWDDVYDPEDDVYYVSFGTGEPSYCVEVDDMLVVEVGLFSSLPTGYRILNKSKIATEERPRAEIAEIIKERLSKVLRSLNAPTMDDREAAVTRSIDKMFA